MKVISGTQIKDQEYIAMKKDGSTFPTLIYSSRILKDQKPAGIRGIIIDITERKKTEEKHRKSEARYLDLFNSAPVTYLSINMSGDIKDANTAAEAFTGYSVDELKRMKYSELYVEESSIKADRIFKDFQQGIPINSEEMIYKRKDGRKIHGLLSVNPVYSMVASSECHTQAWGRLFSSSNCKNAVG